MCIYAIYSSKIVSGFYLWYILSYPMIHAPQVLTKLNKLLISRYALTSHTVSVFNNDSSYLGD